MTCELLLQSLKQQASQHDVFSSLEYIRSRVEFRTAPDFEVSLQPVLYDGTASALKREFGGDLLRRLNSLVATLKNDQNFQFVALEFRGKADIDKAVATLLMLEPELDKAYRRLALETISSKDRAVSTAINAVTSVGGFVQSLVLAGTLGAFISQPSAVGAAAALVNAGIWFFPLSFGRKAIDHNIVRHDFLHHPLIRYLQQVTKEQPTDRLLMMGSNLTLPLEYHRMLMSFAPAQETVNNGRAAGVRALGTGHTLKCVSAHGSIPQERAAFLDHIVYFDGDTMEPVWIVIYRAYCPGEGEPQPTLMQSPSIAPVGEN